MFSVVQSIEIALRSRKIRKHLHRLRFQEAVRHRGEQGLAHQFPQLDVQRTGGHQGPDLLEHRTHGDDGVRPQDRVRCLLREREGREISGGDAKGRTAVLQGPQKGREKRKDVRKVSMLWQKNMKALALPIETKISATGLSAKEIETL